MVSIMHLLSDLHFEHYARPEKVFKNIDKISGDILILAGDIGYPITARGYPSETYLDILKFFKDRFQEVILVSGNHEYYRCQRKGFTLSMMDTVIDHLAIKANVHYLNCNEVNLKGIRFIGCTGWTPISPQTYTYMNDRNYVFDSYTQRMDIYEKHRSYLESVLSVEDPTTVVITHHCPIRKLLYTTESDPYWDGYAAQHEDLIDTSRMQAWFAGHTHECKEIVYNGVLLKTNPYGYVNEVRNTVTEYTPIIIHNYIQ